MIIFSHGGNTARQRQQLMVAVSGGIMCDNVLMPILPGPKKVVLALAGCQGEYKVSMYHVVIKIMSMKLHYLSDFTQNKLVTTSDRLPILLPSFMSRISEQSLTILVSKI